METMSLLRRCICLCDGEKSLKIFTSLCDSKCLQVILGQNDEARQVTRKIVAFSLEKFKVLGESNGDKEVLHISLGMGS